MNQPTNVKLRLFACPFLLIATLFVTSLGGTSLLSAQEDDPPRPTPEGGGVEAGEEEPGELSKDQKKELRSLEKKLKAAVRAKNPDAIAQFVEALGMFATERSIDLILRAGEAYPSDPVRTSVRNALEWSKHKGGIYYLRAELAELKSIPRGILVVEALTRFEGESSAKPLIGLLTRSRDQTLLVAALQGLRKKPFKSVVEALIAFYKTVQDEQDTLWAETRIALLALTNEQYTVHEDWVSWWHIHKADWVPGYSDESSAMTEVYRPDRDLNLPKIFGNEIASKRVVFIVDKSKSMEKIDKTSQEEGSKGKGLSRMERAKRELVKVIMALRDDVQFNIISYSTDVTVWQNEKLMKATRKGKDRAVKFIQGWQPTKFTNTEGALLQAFEIKDVDTIFLLSDGSPTDLEDGDNVPTDPILEKVKDANRFRKITIHTLGFKGANVGFMKKLALDNHGTYSGIR